jgi:hypothetical protein
MNHVSAQLDVVFQALARCFIVAPIPRPLAAEVHIGVLAE